ncbi:MAG: DUF2207 domain-containing protein [Armatimonadota bacterium]
MKRLWFITGLLILCAVPASAWRITSYDTVMDVWKDSSIIITEVIAADFTDDPHHGIYRDIPLTGQDRYGNNYRLRFKLLGVTDNSGKSLTTKTKMQSGGRMHIRVGDESQYVYGSKIYIIKYRLMRAVHFFSDHDEIYGNAVGHEWTVPIEKATCTVHLPSDVKNGKIQIASYTGLFGSRTSDAYGYLPPGDKHTAAFWMGRQLYPGEGLTVVVGWPKGMVTPPSMMQESIWFVSDNAYFFLPFLFILGLTVIWWHTGRDPDAGYSIAVAYDPPDNLTPAEIGTLVDECVDMRDISASIIDLAIKGYIHIKPEVEKGFLGKKTDYQLKLVPQFDTLYTDPKITPFEQDLLRNLFSGMQSQWVSGLAGTFYTALPLLRDRLYDSSVEKGYFANRPDSIRTNYQWAGVGTAGVGLLGIIGPAYIGVPGLFSIGWCLSIAICGLALLIAARVMPRKTAKGRKVQTAARGFEEYLSRAERDDIERQERNDYFERFLPYAMAFGIAHKWAKAFDGLQTVPPEWYEGDYTTFRPSIFANDLSIASNSWGSSMSTRPRTEGKGSGGFFGGGSGFGGGGFSGGGFGGGGGGAW